MNIKMKALVVAAVAAMSVSGVASAAMDGGRPDNSSLVLTLWDKGNNVSATFDLGLNYVDFAIGGAASTASSNWNLTEGNYADAWNSFFSIADVNNVLWGVAATDYTGSINTPGSMGFIVTVRDGQRVTDLRMAQIGQPMASFDNYVNANNGLGNHADVENGASVKVLGAQGVMDYAYAGNFYGNNKFYGVGPVALSALGEEQGVVQYLNASGGRLLFTEYDQTTFRLAADGQLILTAVPEPETYALLLAGLGLVGAAARRRKSA